MASRRDFIRTTTAAAAMAAAGRALPSLAQSTGRRQATLNGRRVRVIDVHCHCVIPVVEIVKGTPLEKNGGGGGNNILGPQRIEQMDRQGLDIQALSINGYWWYSADRELARRIVRAQNEGLAAWVAAHPDRFVAMASVALQYPDLAAEQLEDGVMPAATCRRTWGERTRRAACARTRTAPTRGARASTSRESS